jgi:LysR family transcriptional regulator, glycine cleavage system transcriptional activator
MSAHLPPLAAVRVFEAVARHLSFTRAGEELGMTQAAVSYQIKLLEERVGTPLFLRRPRQVELTEAGQQLAGPVTRAFEMLVEAFGPTLQQERNTLFVTSVHGFAARWLVQRLGRFQLAHPDLAVRLDTSNAVADFARDGVDVALRSGLGEWPGLVTHKLLPNYFAPILSPKLAETIGGVHTPQDLLKLPIIDPHDPWWGLWLAAAGVEGQGGDLTSRPDTRLGSQYFDGEVAISGGGVGLLCPAYFRAELADGRLIQPFDLLYTDVTSIWLAYPHARRNEHKIRVFREWLLAEAALGF